MTNSTSLPTPDEARRLLADADATGRQATSTASWPAVAVLLALGSTLSLGTLAMGLTSGTNYLIAMLALIVWIAVIIAFQLAFLRSHKNGFGRRWGLYMGVIFAVYLVAMLVVSTSQGEALLASSLLALALLALSVGAATYEAKAARR